MLLGAYAAVQEMPQHSQVCKLYGLGSSQRITIYMRPGLLIAFYGR